MDPKRGKAFRRTATQRWRTPRLVILPLLVVLLYLDIAFAADITLFCKCLCAPNVTILIVPKCTTCTKAFCMESQVCFLPQKPDLPSTTPLPPAQKPKRDSMPRLASLSEWDGGDVTDGLPTTILGPTTTIGEVTRTTTTTTTTSPVIKVPIEDDGGPVQIPVPTTQPDDDWVATCFQRGSYKDEIIVYSFLVVVSMLVVAAVAKPYLDQVIQIIANQRTGNGGPYSVLS
ncbi:hypothetical protein BC829DRAFT_435066 [Chytridium lagenaria]|nr:hypothetical protein BC829DRAFT_435066 [Chytridium lagenaria]